MDIILFKLTKGADTRKEIIKRLKRQEEDVYRHCLLSLAMDMRTSEAGIKKHIDLLTSKGYIQRVEKNKKPIFLQLTNKGRDAAIKFTEC